MNFDAETLKAQIPYYLTSNDRKKLLKGLESLASGAASWGYFLSDYDNPYKERMLQGDGWRGFRVYKFESSKLVPARAIVISNSCDVDPDNRRDDPGRVIFSPLVKLSLYKNLLNKRGIDSRRVDAKIESIKSQKTSNMFYLPAGGPLKEEYVVRLDDIHSMPVKIYSESDRREKVFTLSMLGFYMFIFKLSVHFCRLQENISREPTIERHKEDSVN